MSKTISRNQYLVALALFTVASKHYRKVKEFEAELAEHLGYERGDTYMDYISDALYEHSDFDRALEKEGFVVSDAQGDT
jgi:hypothetical protein